MTDDFTFTPGSGKTGAAKDIGSGRLAPLVIPTESDGSDTALAAKLGGLTETAPASDTASAGLNGRLQRIAQRLTTLIGSTIAVSGTFWQATQPVSASSLPLPSGASTSAKQDTGNTSVASIDTKTPALGQALAAASVPVVLPAAQITTLTPPAAITGFALDATLGTTNTEIGGLTETAPATDTASSGLNGRLQRIAQRLTSLIALLPTALGANGGFKIEGVASGTAVPVSIASVPSHAVTNAGTFAVQATEADGANTTLGAKADAKSSATDTTSITIMSILKQISFSIQAAAASLAGTITVASHAVTNAGTFAVQAASAGDVASGSSDSGNPIKTGFVAKSAEPTAVTTGQRVNAYSDLVGKQIVLPYANPENFVSGVISSAMTGTTTTSLIAAPAAGLRNYITQITVSNSHATVGTDILIQDGSGGTTLYVIPAAAAYGGATLTFPTPLRQPTTATAIFAANVTTGSSIKISASGYKGA